MLLLKGLGRFGSGLSISGVGCVRRMDGARVRTKLRSTILFATRSVSQRSNHKAASDQTFTEFDVPSCRQFFKKPFAVSNYHRNRLGTNPATLPF